MRSGGVFCILIVGVLIVPEVELSVFSKNDFRSCQIIFYMQSSPYNFNILWWVSNAMLLKHLNFKRDLGFTGELACDITNSPGCRSHSTQIQELWWQSIARSENKQLELRWVNMWSRCRKEGSRRGVGMEETNEHGVIAKVPNTLQTLANEVPPRNWVYPILVLYVKERMRILWNSIGTPMRQMQSRKLNIKSAESAFSRTDDSPRCFIHRAKLSTVASPKVGPIVHMLHHRSAHIFLASNRKQRLGSRKWNPFLLGKSLWSLNLCSWWRLFSDSV